jgi:hypothetical protein
MKSGLTITEMAQELERQASTKRDFIADTRQLSITGGKSLALNLGSSVIDLNPNDHFRRQVTTLYKVPADYAERIRTQHPDLYDNTLNTFFQKEPQRRMVRVLDGDARAFLSDRYRPLDNFALAEAVLPVVMAQPSVRMESSQFTPTRFYMKLVFPKIETEVKRGDVVQLGLNVSNSEVGEGSLNVQVMVYRLVCLNGLIVPDMGQKRYHVGKRADETESAFEMYTDKTRALDDAAFFSKVRDTIKGVLKLPVLETVVQKMRDATEQKIEGTQIQNVIEVTAKRFGYTEATSGGILRHLIEGGDLTRYGLMNAITRQSQDEADYETATRMEMDGARIIELPKSDWRTIADAALAA